MTIDEINSAEDDIREGRGDWLCVLECLADYARSLAKHDN